MARPLIGPDDLIWIHDYHLIPCAEALRRLGVRNRIGFFLHTPWPARELLLTLPRHQNLVRALFAYDLIGFQTETDSQAFHDYVVNECGGQVLPDGTAICFGRSVATGTFPIGIDVDMFADLPNGAPARRHQRRIEQSTGGRRLIFGVDRLDYSKGIPDRFAAYERLLEAQPEHRNNVVLLQIATASRSEVDEYQDMRLELEAMAGRINGRYADYDWVPLRYVNRAYSQAALAGLYRAADIAFITPLRDGMNLVAKEFVAAQDPADPGVLVLSRFAGARHELREALIVNPYDRAEMADALQRALAMPLDERRARWRSMMDSLVRNDVVAWREGFVAALQSVPDSGDITPIGNRIDRAAG
jgi:trehalose 6-phosphate synthase